MNNTTSPKQVHEGKNIKRFREIMGMKQDTLADALGDDWTQKKISLLEAKEAIEPELLERVAKILKVPVEAIKNLDDESTISIIANTFNSHDHSLSTNHNCTFNPLDKVVELYERMLKEKDELIAKLMKK